MHFHGPTGWDRHDIVAEIRRRGSSLAELARQEGLKRPTMTWSLVMPHKRANRAIADFLGVSLNRLWPEWYDAQGNQISLRSQVSSAHRRADRITRGSHPARATARRVA